MKIKQLDVHDFHLHFHLTIFETAYVYFEN